MTPQNLQRIGKRLFGHDWQSPLARHLGKHRITVWRWATGRVAIPDSEARAIKLLEKDDKANSAPSSKAVS